MSKILPQLTVKTHRRIFTFSRSIIYSTSFWTIYPKMSFPTKQQALRKVKFGECFIIFNETRCLPLSVSSRNLTGAFLRIASASVRHLQRLRLSSIMKIETNRYSCFARKSYLKTGILSRAIMSTTQLRRIGFAMTCCIIPTFRVNTDNQTALILTA